MQSSSMVRSVTRMPPRPGFSPDHARAALVWFDSMRGENEWQLSIDEQIELLGGIKKRTYQNWKSRALAGEPIELNRDTMERLSLLLGIYKALQLIAPAGRPQLARQWFNTPNKAPLFGSLSPKDYLIHIGSMEGLYAVRRYLDRARG